MVAEHVTHPHEQEVYDLERMDNVEMTKKKMLPSDKISIEEYFDGCFGINHSDKQKPATKRIKV